MSSNNALSVEVYSSGTTLIPDIHSDLSFAQAVGFDTFYPGGIYGSAMLYVPRDILQWWAIQGAKRIVLRNGADKLDIVWEGEIDSLSGQVAADGEGILITCTGFWGAKLMRRRLRRNYVDKRVSNDAWQELMTPGGGAGGGGESKFRITRSNDAGDVLLFTPENKALAATDLARLDYIAPTGEGIKKVVFDYDFTEKAGETFTGSLNDATGGAAAFTVSATGTGNDQAWTAAAAAATTRIYFQLASGAVQTPSGDSQTYFEISDGPKVYAWTSNTGNFADTMDAIAKDLVAEFTTVFNGDVTNIDTPGTPFTFTSFLAEWIPLADILARAASYGDGATPPNAYAVYLDHSETATTPNGLPVLVLEAQPALTSYDVGVRLDGPNVLPSVSVRQDFTNIWNWIIVKYRAAGSQTGYLTPDDQATLTDSTSTTDYGQRDKVLDFGQADSATALQLGKAFLAKWKDPHYVLDGPINVQGYIEDANGQPVPVCRVRAGMRIRILDYIDDLSGTGLTMIITGTQYNAETETVSITTGAMDDLASVIAQLEFAAGLSPGAAGSSRADRAGRG